MLIALYLFACALIGGGPFAGFSRLAHAAADRSVGPQLARAERFYRKVHAMDVPIASPAELDEALLVEFNYLAYG